MAVTSDGTPYVEPGDAISAYPVVSQELAAVIDSLRLLIPVGTIAPYAGKVTAGAPEGWLPCDGKAYARTDFADLYTVMAEWLPEWPGGFPSGDSARFYVPDFRGRAPFGVADGVPTSDADIAAPFTLGKRYGDARVPEHIHDIINQAGGPVNSGAGTQSPTGLNVGSTANGNIDQLIAARWWRSGATNPLWQPSGLGRNIPPGTGVHFIVYTGTTTTGKNSTGEQLPAVTTRMMIEARLEEAGLTEEEIEHLREQLAALKEDTDG